MTVEKQKLPDFTPEQEKMSQPERVMRVGQCFDEAFQSVPEGKKAALREFVMEKSLFIPQWNNHHEEGVLMDTHISLMLEACDPAKIPGSLPPYIQNFLSESFKMYRQDVLRFILLHDIGKSQCLALEYEDRTEEITLEEWSAKFKDSDARDPEIVAAFCQNNKIKKIRYFHKGKQNHGHYGVELIRKSPVFSSLHPRIYGMMENHVAAHGFKQISASQYESNFAALSGGEEKWVITAAYVDTMASITNGEPNMDSFINLIRSAQNYHLIKTAEELALSETFKDCIDPEKVKTLVARLKKSQNPIIEEPKLFLESFLSQCSLNSQEAYDIDQIRKNLEAYAISPTTSFTADEQKEILGCFLGNNGMDKTAMKNVRRKLTPVQNQVLAQILTQTKTPKTYSLTSISVDKLFDHDERVKFVAINKLKHKLETGLTKAQKVECMLEAFDGDGVVEKLRLLDEKGILNELIPEFDKNRQLDQDPRFHGGETVGEHAFKAAEIMDIQLKNAGPFSDPRFLKWIRMAAFFHDCGKNMNVENSPEERKKRKKSPQGGGYRTEMEKDGIKRISFVGHAIEGSRLFELISAKYSQILSQEPDIGAKLVSHLINKHMVAIEASRTLEKSSPEEFAEQFLKNIYPVEYSNAGLKLEDVVNAFLLIQEMELKASPAAEQLAIEDKWQEIITAIRQRLPELIRDNVEKRTVPLISGRDLANMDIPEKHRTRILDNIFTCQLGREIVNRKVALLSVIVFCQDEQIPFSQEKAEALLSDSTSTGYRPMTYRMENIRLIKRVQQDGYEVSVYRTNPMRQYNEQTTVEELEQDIHSGNFPFLVSHMEKHEIRSEVILELLTKGKFANLLQMEFFVREYCIGQESILNVAKTRSPAVKAVEIKRKDFDGKEIVIQITNGYQGVRDHTGAGYIHIGEQRFTDLDSGFRKEGESDEAMLQRFYDDVVLHVTGSATLQIPSPPNSSLFFGPIKGDGEKKFAAVIVSRRTAKPRVITTVFLSGAKNLKKNFVRYLRKLREHPDFPYSEEQLQPIIEDCNKFMAEHGQPPISIVDVRRPGASQPNPKSPKKTVTKNLNSANRELVTD